MERKNTALAHSATDRGFNGPQTGGNSNEIASDLLQGADAIAAFIYGDKGHRRKIYHLASIDSIPTFNLGAILCARKSTLVEWIRTQESRNCSRAG
jgi:hypothetical protein